MVRILAATGVLLVGSMIVGAGCAAKSGALATPRATLSVSEGSPEADRLWAAAQDTLRNLHYQLDRVDRQFGVITTLPEGSQQMFEFWRRDVASGRDLVESSLTPLRRRIEVTIRPAEIAGATHIELTVFKQRLSSLDRQFNNSGAAYQFFGERLPATTGQARVTPRDDVWHDIGRDPAMERDLLRRILLRAGLSAEPPAAAPS